MQQERPGAPLPFEACENFGSWAVRHRLRREGMSNTAQPLPQPRACQWLKLRGLRLVSRRWACVLVFDFRSEKERTLAPDPDFPGVVNIPASAMLAEDGSARWISTWKAASQ